MLLTYSYGILPVTLKPVRVTDRTHIFLHEVDLINVGKNINDLINTYKNYTPPISHINLTYLKKVTNHFSNIKSLVNQINEKFNSIRVI